MDRSDSQKPLQQVLVIDGSPAHREVIGSLLEALGVSPLAASTGQEGIQAARAVKPDLILLEALLEDMNGFDVLKAIKADPLLEPIPVIILSSRADDVSRGVAFSLGACDAIAKPFDIAYTMDQIRTILGRAMECRSMSAP